MLNLLACELQFAIVAPMQKSLVVLAAGIGRRYGGLKQMEPVGPSGEFIIDYSVFDAVRAGFEKVVFVIRRDIEAAFRETLGSRLEPHVSVSYVFQELSDLPAGFSLPPQREKPWGTAHALLACAQSVDGPFAVINADDFYGRESYAMLARFLDDTAEDSARYAMVGFRLLHTLSDHGHVARGICTVDAEGDLDTIVERTRIVKKTDGAWCEEQALTGDELVSMNLWGFKPSVFGALSMQFAEFLQAHGGDPNAEFFIPSVVNTLMGDGRVTVRVLTTGSRWFGVTYKPERAVVEAAIGRMVAAGEYPVNLWGR